jgi:hypothetical protein
VEVSIGRPFLLIGYPCEKIEAKIKNSPYKVKENIRWNILSEIILPATVFSTMNLWWDKCV